MDSDEDSKLILAEYNGFTNRILIHLEMQSFFRATVFMMVFLELRLMLG